MRSGDLSARLKARAAFPVVLDLHFNFVSAAGHLFCSDGAAV